jgi:transcriptional repressor NrdR
MMNCPFCSHADTRVVDSRLGREGNNIRRRRECEQCLKRFTTYERVEEMLPLVVKKDGRREAFDRQKIVAGMQRACEKRPVSIAAIEQFVDRLEQSLQESGEKEVPSNRIGEAVMAALHELDQVAYVRFASVYREFRDINEFMAELTEILARGPVKG